MPQFATASLMFLLVVLPTWAEEHCNMKVLKSEEELQKVDAQDQTIQALNITIKRVRSGCINKTKALNATIQEQKQTLEATVNALEQRLETIETELGHITQDQNDAEGEHTQGIDRGQEWLSLQCERIACFLWVNAIG